MKVLFLVNPKSGKKKTYDVAELIKARCGGWTYELQASERKEDLDAILEAAAASGFDVAYAVGGDGTVHEIAKRLVGKPLALGILPTGSGNGFARHLGLPIEPGASLDACQRGTLVTIDSGEVNGVPFLGVMGVGFDAEVAHAFAKSTTRGLRTYMLEGIRAFRRYLAEEYEVTVDGRRVRRKAFVIAVSNSSQYGNDARIAPDASLQDGLLDVVIIDDKVGIFGAIELVVRLFRGTIQFSRNVEVLQGKAITIKRAKEGPVHLDGEPFVMPAELSIRVNPSSLKVLLPTSERRI